MGEATLREGLRMLGDMPEWLVAVSQAARLKDALQRSVPEFAAGTISLEDVQPRRLRLEDDCCPRASPPPEPSVTSRDRVMRRIAPW